MSDATSSIEICPVPDCQQPKHCSELCAYHCDLAERFDNLEAAKLITNVFDFAKRVISAHPAEVQVAYAKEILERFAHEANNDAKG